MQGLSKNPKQNRRDTFHNPLWYKNYSISRDIKIVNDLICEQNRLPTPEPDSTLHWGRCY